MNQRLLEVCPLSGMKTWHIFDPVTEETSLRYEQDVEPVLDDNKEAEASFSRTSRLPDMVHVASIPPSIQLKWLIEKGVDILNPDHKQGMADLLDSAEWKYLKRVPLRLGRVR